MSFQAGLVLRGGRLPLALFVAAVLFATTAVARAADVQNVPVLPAPPLTSYQLEQLAKVHAWDLTYTSSGDLDVAGAGGVTSCGLGCGTVTSWSLDHTQNWSYQVQATLKRSAFPDFPCKFPNSIDPCKVSYSDPGKVDLHSYTEHLRRTIAYADGCGADNLSPDHYDEVLDTSAAGSYVPDGTSGKTAYTFGVGFGIDSTANPPLGKSELGFDAPPGTETTSITDCGTVTTKHADGNVVPSGRLPAGADFYSYPNCCEGGDTQVRIDKSGFVITGVADWTTDLSECLFASVLGCPPAQLAAGVYHERDEWTLRPHCSSTDISISTDPSTLSDLDGDGIPDCWETNGVDANGDGVPDVDLPAMGASPAHKDVFVQLDAMAGHSLDPAAIQKVIDAFDLAPVEDPDGTSGINLHVDAGPNSVMDAHGDRWGALSRANESIPSQPVVGENPLGSLSDAFVWHGFDAIKEQYFPQERVPIFHYGVVVRRFGSATNNRTGEARAIPGSDFMLALGFFSPTVTEQAGAFMHELGHNLGLHHGGGDDINYKPNYLSVMNYNFNLSGLDYNGQAGRIDYSEFPDAELPPLDEHALDENKGVVPGLAPGQPSFLGAFRTVVWCGTNPDNDPNAIGLVVPVLGPVDFNCDAHTGGVVKANINGDRDLTGLFNFYDTLHSYDDWDNLVYTGGAIGYSAAVPVELPIAPEHEAPLETLRVAEHLLQAGSDSSPPQTSALTDPAANAAGWNNGDVHVTLNAIDPDGAGDVAHVEYEATGAQPIAATTVSGSSATVTISAEGVTQLRYFATDQAGNAETAHTLTIRIDRTPPTVTPASDRPPDANGWYNHRFSVTWTGADALSGIDSCTPPSSYAGPDTGAGSLTGRCTDEAGNVGSTRVSFRYDATPPTVSCTARPSVLWPPDHKLDPVTTAVTVGDALSGPAGFFLGGIAANEGDPLTDAVGWTVGTSSTSGRLRAERLGTSRTGRVYTLMYTGSDLAGNTATCTTTVTVPHDLGH